ncbi:S-layer homology domain-containing protein [Aedoeadaptatus urinae]|uniref:S-layer homology domain-containing protein n=1 Tax=Aedoeadaptatus urinae TaxID=1871017 RepID=UPI0009F84829|nr:S-layer homology domain-containing protein [Peptoniphilus urinae]
MKRKFLSLIVAMVMVVGIIAPSLGNIAYAAPPSSTSAIWLDGTNGDDSNDGSQEKPVKTFAKAMKIINDGETLNVLSLAETNITVNKKVTLKFLNDATMQGTGTGIELAEGSRLTVADGKTLTMSGYKTAINVKKGAEINDGNYVLDKNEIAFSLADGAKINGTSKDNLQISAKEQTGRGFSYSSDSWFIGCTVYVEGKLGSSEQYSGLYMKDASLTTKDVWYYFDPCKQKDGTLKGGLHLDNSEFYVYKAKGVRGYKNSFALLGPSEIKNNSTVTADGSRVTVSEKLLVKDSKFVIKNSTDGGLNINYKPGEVIFENSTFETTNMQGIPSYGTGRTSGPCYLTFKGNSVVNTDAKDRTADCGGANRGTGSTYVVKGGSYLVAYDPTYNYDVTTPTNGKENGDEYLSYFTLKDGTINELKPINKNGVEYIYPVANASKDNKKHVFVPAAKVTFKLNNNDASFADNTNADKEVKTIRGYKLDDVVGNVNPGEPTDKNGVKFLGWFYKTDNGEEKAFDWDERLTTDTEAYAKWERKTVIYHNGAGKDYISSAGEDAENIEVLSFEDIVKEKADFNVVGKKFVGWTTAPDGSGKVYKAKEKINFTEGKSQIDFYAKYTDNEYKVSFSANGGTFSENSIFKKNPGVFTIEKDANGGEVAVLKIRAKYNDKLFDLLNGLDHNQLKPDTNATKTGFIIRNKDYWSTTAETGGKAIRFDDYSFFGFSMKGENPQITADTTYYMTWQDDPNVATIRSDEALGADIWGQDRASSPKVQVVTPGEAFSLTGEINAKSIKDKMQGIETVFDKHTDAEFSSIALSNVSSTFKATLTMPDDVIIPENPTVTAKGLGNCFDLGKAEVKGQKVTIPFTLKPGMADYKKLKDAVFSTGQVSEDRTNNSLISVKIDGLKLKDGVADGQKVTVTGAVDGTFSALAKDNATLKRFSFTWKGQQTPEGKDEAATSEGIQYTLMMSKPTEFNLPGDLLVKKGQEGYDTTHLAIYPIDESDTLTFKGQLDVSPIKNQINLLADGQSSTDKIDLEKVKSGFVAKIEIPQGLEIPDKVQATLTENDLFEVTDVSKAGNVITVRMDLKKSYTKFDDLKKDVNAAGGDESILNVEIPGIIVKDNTSGKKFVAKGQVEGSFFGIAKKEKTTRVFNFAWKAQQTPDGKDVRQSEDDNTTIQLTLALPEQFDLPGDILIGEDTEHDALHKVKPGELLEFTGRLDVTSIKDKINLLKSSYGQDTSKIKTDNVKSTFIAKLEIPEGLEIPSTPTATLTNNDLFEIKNGDVYRDGNQIVVKMTLKKAYSKFDNLWKDVNAVPNTLDLKVPGIKVKDSLVDGTKKTVLGHVEGNFEGTAASDSGKMQNYHFKWIGKQTPDGRDFILKGTDSESIQYTVVVNREPKPTPEPTPEPTPSTPGWTVTPSSPADSKLNLVDHLAYMKGYPDLTFGPDRNMTRAEVTMMFARLLKDRPEANKVYAMPYSDVTKADWYAYAVSYMTENKLIMGYPDGTFKPNSPISRAEFAAIASRFDQLKPGLSLPFNDVAKGHWAYDVIASAANKGWVNGYPDGSFKPENKITRAEVVSTTNRMLNRYADLAFAKAHKTELAPMRDMDESHWAYGAAVEAMNGHDYYRQADGKNETWILLNGKRFTFPIAPSGMAN